MVLRDVLELDTAETAELLGLSPEAVRVRLHRARAAIATALTSLTQEVYRFDGARCARITARVMSNVLATTPLPG
jgi:RNA polymerase sigma-70 factor (ECF subfamily)